MKEELLNEIEDLRNVIAWSKENGGLTTGQRIVVHQKIAQHLKDLGALEDGLRIEPIYYPLPPLINDKVRHIQGVIEYSNWQKQELKY